MRGAGEHWRPKVAFSVEDGAIGYAVHDRARRLASPFSGCGGWPRQPVAVCLAMRCAFFADDSTAMILASKITLVFSRCPIEARHALISSNSFSPGPCLSSR